MNRFEALCHSMVNEAISPKDSAADEKNRMKRELMEELVSGVELSDLDRIARKLDLSPEELATEFIDLASKYSKLMIADGKSAGVDEDEFNANDLAIGTKIEKEHTSDPAVARKIAKDHLTEFSNYYQALIQMEKDLEAGKFFDRSEEEEEEPEEE